MSMNRISHRIEQMAASETLAMSQKSSELKAQGVDVINLSVGEPDFPTPMHIKEAAKNAIDQNFTSYPPVPGYLSLRQAIADKLLRENGVEVTPQQIVCSNGAKQALCNAILSLVNPGDEVIIPAPCWVSYVEMVKLAGGKPVIVYAGIEQEFKISPQQLEDAITDKTRLFILCSPNNPTGSVYNQQEMDSFAQVLDKHAQVFVLCDEIYEHIQYNAKGGSLAKVDFMRERVAIINGVSKAYSMTGWRLGWMAAPLWLAQACNKLQGQYTSSPCSIAQKAAEEAYNGSQSCVEEMRKAFEKRRNLILQLIREIPQLEANTPQGAFYVFPKCGSLIGKSFRGETIVDTAQLSMYLLQEAHVASVGGNAFFAPEHIRFSYATGETQIIQAFERIKKAIEKLK